MLEHAADGGGQGPRLPPQQALHAALGRQQGEVRQTPAGVQAEELVAVDGNVQRVCEGRSGDEEGKRFKSKGKGLWGFAVKSIKASGKSKRIARVAAFMHS